jgi:murein DD-endopeptidase MepM/ murein hydrolase activator NlpD
MARRPSFRSFRSPRRWLTGATVLAVLLSAVPVVGADPDPRFARQSDDPIAVAKAQREALQARIAGQEDRLSQLAATGERLDAALQKTSDSLAKIMVNLTELQAEVVGAQNELAAAEARRDELQQQVGSLDWSLDVLAGQADELADELADRRRQLGARLADAYRAGQTGLWEQVIEAGSFLDAVVHQQGALALGEHDREQALSIQHDQTLLDEQRLELRHLRYDTETLRTQVAAAATSIAADRDRLLVAEAGLADLEARTAALHEEQQQRYAGVLHNQAKVSAIIRSGKAEAVRLTKRVGTLLEKERHAGRLPSAFNGTFRWPLIGDISQEFGCTGFVLEPPRDDCEHFHTGIDIVATPGTPVRAPTAGVVLFVGFDPDVPKKDAAYFVMIAHSDHLVSILGHLQAKRASGIAPGVRVTEGQIVGWEGNTGNSTGAHLHWSVVLDDEPINPRFFL